MLVETVLKNHIGYITMNRPEVHNAFDDQMIQQLIQAIEQFNQDSRVRIICLQSNGKHFSAGADLNWMQKMVDLDFQENLTDAQELARLMDTLYHCPKPTVAKIQGAAYGGALGLICCCDIAFASDNATFCFSEVKIGLIPAVIAPYALKAIGTRQAKRYFLSAETFTANTALHIGLIHHLVEPMELEDEVEKLLLQLEGNSPKAMVAAKTLIETLDHNSIDTTTKNTIAQAIAKIRVSEQGQEGLKAFLEKRKPEWLNN